MKNVYFFHIKVHFFLKLTLNEGLNFTCLDFESDLSPPNSVGLVKLSDIFGILWVLHLLALV